MCSMGTFVSKLEIWFYYYLIDMTGDVAGVLKVNTYVTEEARYRRWALRQVTETEHDTMSAFGLPEYTHDGKNYPFFEDCHGQPIDIRA